MGGISDVLDWLFVAYFVVLNGIYSVLLMLGSRQVDEWVRRRPLRDMRRVTTSRLSLPVTIIVPAFNESAVIVHSVRSLLALRYRELQVLVVNDGSTDDTLNVLRETFDLVPVDRVPRAGLPTQPVRSIYSSRAEDRLTVIDKVNGGKADTLNAGINYAAYPLFCAIDSDTMLDPDALARLVWAFHAEPETVATGGIVRIVNGSKVSENRVVEVHTPDSLLARLQIMEYLRAFLAGRAGWSRLGMVVIISGAFGLFRRDVVAEAGGYLAGTVGEDAELIVRLHRHCRERGRPYRISFVADPICWTEAPTSVRVLYRQRDRWQRGLLETLWRHRGMMLNRRYGRIGLVALPYYLLFEALGPIIEVAGILYMVAGLLGGWVQPQMALTVASLALTYGLVLSFGALLIEQEAYARHPGWRCLRRLGRAAVIENFGYRQWLALVRMRAWWTVFRHSHWGEIPRNGFDPQPLPPPAVPAPAATG
jgi:cellulose synthase/poly-beta-1,6-N-acetylglucosamine synthase-like glycosyltransferase